MSDTKKTSVTMKVLDVIDGRKVYPGDPVDVSPDQAKAMIRNKRAIATPKGKADNAG